MPEMAQAESAPTDPKPGSRMPQWECASCQPRSPGLETDEAIPGGGGSITVLLFSLFLAL